MFKQFLDNATGVNQYLITSLALFLVFFILVAVLLLRMKKDDINYMSDLPLNDEKSPL